MTIRRLVLITFILLVPLSVILAAVYEIATGKKEATLYLLLVAVPGALIAAIKVLIDNGLLPTLAPTRLILDVDQSRGRIYQWEQGLSDYASRRVTDIVFPIRISNSDSKRDIDILDVSTMSLQTGVTLEVPQKREVPVGSQKLWLFTMANGGYTTLFNDGKQKTIEATKVKDDVVGVREFNEYRCKYRIRLTFRDNFKRTYSQDVEISNVVSK